jgi:hypothetical protein
MVAFVLVLVGCGPSVTSGTIVKKTFIAAHYDEYTTYYCMMRSQTGGCMVQVPENHRDFVPDNWRVVLRANCEKPDHRKCPQDWHSVDHATYDRLEIGSQWEVR